MITFINPVVALPSALQAQGPVRLQLQVANQIAVPAQSANVIAEVPGTDLADEIVQEFFDGPVRPGIIGEIGTAGGTGSVIEFAGSAIRDLSMQGRWGGVISGEQHAVFTSVAGNDSSPEWCTVSQRSRLFSYRRDGVTGRFAVCIWRH